MQRRAPARRSRRRRPARHSCQHPRTVSASIRREGRASRAVHGGTEIAPPDGTLRGSSDQRRIGRGRAARWEADPSAQIKGLTRSRLRRSSRRLRTLSNAASSMQGASPSTLPVRRPAPLERDRQDLDLLIHYPIDDRLRQGRTPDRDRGAVVRRSVHHDGGRGSPRHESGGVS